jgi:acyl-CoA thioester hydrolase
MRIGHVPSVDPADYVFTQRIRVRFAETDAMGIVHHGRYLPYLEEARVAYLRHIGHPYAETRDAGIDFAILEVWLRYRQPLRFDEEVDVHLRVIEVTRATFQIAYVLTVAGNVRTTAITAHGAVSHQGHPTRLPAWLRHIQT